ncbi:MAG: hypothetical protein KF734_06865 [Saprospiraceae bacterium]|nr:hypothetical protein [Saprospiraceae bacterium]
MKNACLILLVCILCRDVAQGQNAQRLGCEAKLYLQKPPNVFIARMEVLLDSSILVSSMFDTSIQQIEIPISRIVKLKQMGRRGHWVKYGFAMGASIGFVAGILSAKDADPNSIVRVPRFANGFAFAIVGGAVGGIVGGAADVVDPQFRVDGNQRNYEQKKEALRKLLQYH